MDPDTDYAAPLRPMLDPLEGRRGPVGRWRPREVDADLRDELHKAVGKTASPDFVAPPPMGRVLGAPPGMAMEQPPGVLSQGQAQGLAAGALEPFGQAGRLMTGRSQDVPGDLASVGAAMIPIGPPGAAAALKPTYSALGRAVAGLKQSAMHPEQWLGFLKNQPGVKAAELEHVGLADWLKAHKGPVSRETVQELIGARQPAIDVIRKGTGGPEYERALQETQRAFDEFAHTQRGTPEADAAMGRFQAATERAEALKPGRSKFDEYQLPGGSNYGETLLTLPSEAGIKPSGGFSSTEDARAWNSLSAKDYKSTHWDEPNVLLHTRHNDRTVPGPNGEPMNALHMEELQSDWHQAGRKKGYNDPAKLSALTDEYHSLTPVARGPALTAEHADARSAARMRQGEITDQMNYLHDSVPDASFKQTWADLGLKHMLHRAATERNPNGSYKYDALSWTPGAAQNARYSGRGAEEEAGMSKFYDEILSNKANALVKSAGGRVQQSTMDARRRDAMGRISSVGDRDHPVHVLRITPAVRAAAEKGFPTFAIGGAAALGAQQDRRQ